MKKAFAFLVVSGFCLAVQAQNIVPAGVVDGKPSQTQTSVYVNITVTEQEIIAGPYARYAQKYLGVAAPLTDKKLYEITGATIATQPAVRSNDNASEASIVSLMNPAKGFPKLLIDRTSNSSLSLEENARAAANRIFDIRRSRYELITGDAGENVFGAGLGSALAELDKLEEEYLSLFLGKQTTVTRHRQCKVVPTAGKETYILCRFSTVGGLLPSGDLTGEAIVLETIPLNNISTAGFTVVQKPDKTDRAFLVADDVSCRVVFDNTEIASETLAVLQFGRTLYLR
ncbi:MAG: DUF4831 family protein [Rikenellaceae bacterium]|nr:DUF4831 family protein [Rikenellaceae bacterium]